MKTKMKSGIVAIAFLFCAGSANADLQTINPLAINPVDEISNRSFLEGVKDSETLWNKVRAIYYYRKAVATLSKPTIREVAESLSIEFKESEGRLRGDNHASVFVLQNGEDYGEIYFNPSRHKWDFVKYPGEGIGNVRILGHKSINSLIAAILNQELRRSRFEKSAH